MDHLLFVVQFWHIRSYIYNIIIIILYICMYVCMYVCMYIYNKKKILLTNIRQVFFFHYT